MDNKLSKSEIFTAYNHFKKYARGNDKALDRLNKALGILQRNDYYTGERADYLPNPENCGCKDWEFRNTRRRGYTGACKHMLAEMMMDYIYARRDFESRSSLMDAKRDSAGVLESSYRI